MTFQLRKTSLNDIHLYEQCLNSHEFTYMLYHGEQVNVSKYIADNKQDRKFIVSIKSTLNRDIGFAHFYRIKDNTYSYVGGLLPSLFNSGLGLYASIAILSYMFEENSNYIFTTGVYNDNIRSLKMVRALGFSEKACLEDKTILCLDYRAFNNELTTLIKHRISYEYMSFEALQKNTISDLS